MNNKNVLSISEVEKSNTQSIYCFLSSKLMYVVTALMFAFTLAIFASFVLILTINIISIVQLSQSGLESKILTQAIASIVIKTVLICIPYYLFLNQLIRAVLSVCNIISSAKNKQRDAVVSGLRKLDKAVLSLRTLLYAGYFEES